MRHIFITVVLLAVAANAHAQGDRLGSGAPPVDYRAGWTFTPTVGVAEAYDDNVTLFAVNTAESLNNDYVMTFFPSADLHYEGAHTQFGVGYGGSFLGYRTFDGLDRWDQHGSVDLRRQETARFKWFAHASGMTQPETDLINFGGIPYRKVGSTEIESRGGATYDVNARDSLTFTTSYQDIRFERTDLASPFYLRGGTLFDAMSEYRHKVSSRLAFGADYTYRRALVVGDPDHFDLHGIEGAVDYVLNELWSVSAAAGIVYMQPTLLQPSRTGPAYRIGVERHHDTTAFHVSYVDSYIPAFGYGGIVKSQELGAGFRAQLFGSRRFYTENSISFRDDTPIVASGILLPLRSLREYSVFGWQPDRWVRFEVFYARTDQTSTLPGGMINRNRIGFQIVTSKPMRMQ